jgi:hypothetical protein
VHIDTKLAASEVSAQALFDIKVQGLPLPKESVKPTAGFAYNYASTARAHLNHATLIESFRVRI